MDPRRAAPENRPAEAGAHRDRLADLADEALVAELAGGREAAFAELFRRYRPRIEQFVRWHASGRVDTVEEMTQEIFVQLYRSLPGYAGRSSFRTWLYALARNVCRHRRRKRRRRLSFERPEEELGEQGWQRVPDLAPSVVDRLAAGELRRSVREEVDRLAPIYRTVLLLRDWEELSYAEIARVLELPVGTVRSRLHEARAQLTSALAALSRTEGDDEENGDDV